MSWEPFAPAEGHTVVGDVRVWHDVHSPGLEPLQRDILALLPPSHGRGRRFPVLLMHDGLDLFGRRDIEQWRVDETMKELAAEGVEAVVVAIPYGRRPDRGPQYAGERADAYLAFLVDTVLPLVRDAFDLEPSREATGLAGASLGGVISLYGIYAHPRVFGFAGVFSPAFWWNGDRLFETVEQEPAPPARIYLDVGDQEDEDEERRRAYLDGFQRMTALLHRRGFGDDDLLAVLEKGGRHHESAWARRLPDALRFLLRPFGEARGSGAR